MRISDWSSDVCSSDLIAMNDGAKVIPEAIDRSAIYNLSDFVVRLGASEVVLALEERRNALPLSDLLRIKTTGVHVNDLSSFLERETGRVDLDSVNQIGRAHV